MIIKHREKPVRLLAHEAGMRRVPKNHPKYPLIEKEYYRLHYGYKGEEAMDYYSSFLPHEDYKVLHGLRLQDTKGRYFQMDSLLISPSHCLIFDSKYINGVLEFDLQNSILVRHKEEGHERFSDPFTQVARHKFQLEGLIENLKFPSLPIYTLVVLTHNQARLHPTTPTVNNQLTFHTNLPIKIKSINDLYKNTVLTNKELQKLARTLYRKHELDSFNFMQHYGLSFSEIIKGVICSTCSFAPMEKLYQAWKCSRCMNVEKEPVVQALWDFKYLGLGNSITNKKFRVYMCVDSKYVASRLLTKQNFSIQGTKKGRTYILEFEK